MGIANCQLIISISRSAGDYELAGVSLHIYHPRWGGLLSVRPREVGYASP